MQDDGHQGDCADEDYAGEYHDERDQFLASLLEDDADYEGVRNEELVCTSAWSYTTP